MNNNQKYLHSIRGIAALLVVIFHAKFVLWCGGHEYLKTIGLHGFLGYLFFALDMLSSCGKQCVVVFFILSAYVIKHSYERNNYTIIEFYKLRAIRIYLPYLFSLLFSVMILIIVVPYINPLVFKNVGREYNTRLLTAYNDFSFFSLVKALLFLPGREYAGFNFAYWSLLHEFIFYLIFPIYNLLQKKQLWVAGILLLLLYSLYPLTVLYYQVYFICGLLFYDYFQSNRSALLKSKTLYILLIGFLFVLLNIFVNLFNDYMADILVLPLLFLIFDFILNYQVKVRQGLMYLGDISYSLYLNHLPFLLLIYVSLTKYFEKYVFYDRWIYYLSSVAAIGIGILTYFLIERPSIKILKSIKGKRA